MTSNEEVMRSMETMLLIFINENHRLWWISWDMFWGWLGAEIHLDVLMCLCEKHRIVKGE